ncbi:unnamed protein product, partial [Owenia fusiformis]
LNQLPACGKFCLINHPDYAGEWSLAGKVIRNHPNNTTTIEWRVLYKLQYREYKQGRGVEMETINTNLILKHSFELTPNNSLPKKIIKNWAQLYSGTDGPDG